MKRFLIIDDHVVVRSGLKIILTDHFTPCEIDEAIDGESAILQLKLKHYDLVVLDIKMPNTDALQLMEYIKITYPTVNVIIFSMNSETIYAKRFLKAGAKGFVNKDAPLEEVVKGMQQVLAGKKYISAAVIELLAEFGTGQSEENLFNHLSPRECEITMSCIR